MLSFRWGDVKIAPLLSIRALEGADCAAIVGFETAIDCALPNGWRRELDHESNVHWIGLFEGATLVGVHRAVCISNWLILKGAFVRPDANDPLAGFRMAMHLTKFAEAHGAVGIAAWMPISDFEDRTIAKMLKLKPGDIPVHRYLVPRTAMERSQDGVPGRIEPYDDRPLGAPLCPDQLGAGHVSGSGWSACSMFRHPGGIHGPFNWLIEGERLSLYGTPVGEATQLPAFLAALARLPLADQCREIDLPIPAADISLGFQLLGLGAKRLSRTAMTLARKSFVAEA